MNASHATKWSTSREVEAPGHDTHHRTARRCKRITCASTVTNCAVAQETRSSTTRRNSGTSGLTVKSPKTGCIRNGRGQNEPSFTRIRDSNILRVLPQHLQQTPTSNNSQRTRASFLPLQRTHHGPTPKRSKPQRAETPHLRPRAIGRLLFMRVLREP